MLRRKGHRSASHNYAVQKKNLDLALLIAVLVVTLIGLIMVYDSSVIQAFNDYKDKFFYIKQQLIWVGLGFISLLFFTFFDYHHLKKLSGILFIASFLLLLAVFIPKFGIEAGGAHRWLKLGAFTLQPAEIIKLSSIMFFAALFTNKKGLWFFGVTFVLVTLILAVFQKDMGSAIVYSLTGVGMFFLSGAPLIYFLGAIPFTLMGFLVLIFSSSYRKQRVLAFLDPFSDPKGYSYHISQVLIALGSGGWFGLGLGQSRQKFSYIPEVTTDSIFAIVGEEFGFMGALVLISLLSFLVYRGIKIAEASPDDFGKILGYGLTLWLGIQAALNISAMVALVPLTGVPLPFISYGGSALLTDLTAVGILLNISRSSNI